MDTNAYKRAALKTTQPKLIKAGLRHLTKNTQRAVIAHAILGLKTESGELLRGLNSYILGEQLRPEAKATAKGALACYGYWLILGARPLKIKTPSASKKVKLAGQTRTQAILALDANSTDMLTLVHQYLSASDASDDLTTLDTAFIEKLTALFNEAVALFWPLVYDTLGETPDAVFQYDFDQRKGHYPAGFFDAPVKAEPEEPVEGAPAKPKSTWKPGQKKTPPAAEAAPETPAASA